MNHSDFRLDGGFVCVPIGEPNSVRAGRVRGDVPAPRPTPRRGLARRAGRQEQGHGCQMAKARILESYLFGPYGFWTMALPRYAARFDPFLSLDCAPRPPPWHNPRKGRDQILPSGNTEQGSAAAKAGGGVRGGGRAQPPQAPGTQFNRKYLGLGVGLKNCFGFLFILLHVNLEIAIRFCRFSSSH